MMNQIIISNNAKEIRLKDRNKNNIKYNIEIKKNLFFILKIEA